MIKRLLESGPQVLATGGGAVIPRRTRERIAATSFSVWLSAPVDVLFQRVSRRDTRPLLKNADPRGTLTKLLAERTPYYAQATMTFESQEASHEITVANLLGAIAAHLREAGAVQANLAP